MANIENEMNNAFKTVGIIVESRISSYCNDGKEAEAKELKQALSILNKHFENKLNVEKVDK